MNREAILQEAAAVGFDGETYSHELDGKRLTGLMGRVFDCVKDGNWWTLARISEATGGSEGGCAARLRDLRKERFGGFNIERKRSLHPGIHFYRLNGELQREPAKDCLPMPDNRLQVAVAALQRIAAGEGEPRPAGVAPFPKWAQMQALARRTLREMGE